MNTNQGWYSLGIDLGATNTVVSAVSDTGHTEIVRGNQGDLATPSAVFFDEQKLLIGEEALLRGNAFPDRLAVGFKEDLGKPVFHQTVKGCAFPPAVVLGSFLYRLRSWLSRRFGSDFPVSIGVPAWYGEVQKQALANAAEIAGLRVVDLINVPLAAGLAYSESAPLASQKRQHLLVYDLGGSDCETAVIELDHGQIRMLAHDHVAVGGRDWDQRLVNHIANSFLREHKIDLRGHADLMRQLQHRAAKARHALGLRDSALVQFEYQGQARSARLTREMFARLGLDLVTKTTQLAETTLQKAGLAWRQIDQVLLVGGGTHMRPVRERLGQLWGRPLESLVSPDEAVARGAALLARNVAQVARAQGGSPRIRVINVTAHSLGIEGVDPATGKKTNRVMIPRGTLLPAKASRTFTAKASGQHKLSITVLEGGEDETSHGVAIGQAVIDRLPPEMVGDWPVDVAFEYTGSGRLKIDVQVRYLDRQVHLELMRAHGLASTQVARWRAAVQSNGGLAALREALEGLRAPPPIAVAVDAPPPEQAKSWGELAGHYARQLFGRLGLWRGEEAASGPAADTASARTTPAPATDRLAAPGEGRDGKPAGPRPAEAAGPSRSG